MKNAKIFHGTGCTPNCYWFPYVKKELEIRKYIVWSPDCQMQTRQLLNNGMPFATKRGYMMKIRLLLDIRRAGHLLLSILKI